MEYLEDNTDTGQLDNGLYKFKCIKDHRGPYTSSDPEHLGSSCNLLIEWETEEMTWEPISNIIASDPYTCTVFAKKHDLLNTPGWNLLKRHARTARRLIRTLKKSKYRQTKASGKYKHRWKVPRDDAHALQLDIQNGNNKWKDGIDLEIEQSRNIKYSKIMERLLMRKIRLVMLLRDIERSEYILSLMSNTVKNSRQDLWQMDILPRNLMKLSIQELFLLRNLREAMFLADLNNLQLWGADVGNAYLRAPTKEKLYIVHGPVFEELQGHVLVVQKELYGTRSGGACWHDKHFDILYQMGFKPSKADPDIWMKPSKDDNHYEYIAVYVDDLAICMKDPQAFCDTLKEKYKLKLQAVGSINYHLGCGYTRDEDGTLVVQENILKKFLSHMKKCLVVNQRSTEHHQWQEIIQKMTYLNFVIKTKSISVKELLDS